MLHSTTCIRSSLSVALVAAAILFGNSGMVLADTDPRATGYRPPTAAEQAWFAKNAATVGTVRPNRLGLDRINRYLDSKGEAALNLVPAPIGQEVLPPGTGSAGGSAAAPAPADVLPDHVDNSETAYFPPISSQGGLGCCAAFSTTYYQFTTMANMANDRAIDGDNNRYSPKWTFNQVNGGGNNGTNFSATYEVLKRNGCASWADLPYDDNCTFWNTDPEVWKRAMHYRIDQVGTLGLLRSDTELNNLKAMLNNGSIIAFSTSIGNWQYTKISDDQSTDADDDFVDLDVVSWTKGGCDHAMVIVGYNDNIWTDINGNGQVDGGEKGAIRIANSWGEGFNDGGFTWIAYDALTAGSKVPGYSNGEKGDLIIETAWITVKPEYSPRLIAQFTLSHARRNQMKISLGYSSTDRTTPEKTWDSDALNEKGGPLAFDGGTNEMDGTFALDFSDLISDNALETGLPVRWYLSATDMNGDGVPLSVKSFKVIDGNTGEEAVSGNTFPASIDNGTIVRWVDFALGSASRVTASSSLGGTVTPAGTTRYEDHTNVTYTETPAEGFDISDCIVNGVSQGAIGNYTFNDLSGDNTIVFKTLRSDDNLVDRTNSIAYRCYEGTWNALPDFNSLPLIKEGMQSGIGIGNRSRDDEFGMVFSGWIYVPADGDWTFTLASDDGSRFEIDGITVANDDGLHGIGTTATGTIGLRAGYHPFSLPYFNGVVDRGVNLVFEGPTVAGRPVVAEDLFSGSISTVATLPLHALTAPCSIRQSGRTLVLSVPGQSAVEVKLFSPAGRLVQKQTLSASSGFARVETLPAAGAYICKISAEGKPILQQRLILSH